MAFEPWSAATRAVHRMKWQDRLELGLPVQHWSTAIPFPRPRALGVVRIPMAEVAQGSTPTFCAGLIKHFYRRAAIAPTSNQKTSQGPSRYFCRLSNRRCGSATAARYEWVIAAAGK